MWLGKVIWLDFDNYMLAAVIMSKKVINGVCNITDVINNNQEWELNLTKIELVHTLFFNTTLLNIIKYVEKNYPEDKVSVGAVNYVTFCVNEDLFNIFLVNRYGILDRSNNIIKISDSYLIKKLDSNEEEVCYVSNSNCNIKKFRKHFLDSYEQGDEIYFKIEKE